MLSCDRLLDPYAAHWSWYADHGLAGHDGGADPGSNRFRPLATNVSLNLTAGGHPAFRKLQLRHAVPTGHHPGYRYAGQEKCRSFSSSLERLGPIP